MNVKDLIELLQKYKDHTLTFIEGMGYYDFDKFELYDVGHSDKHIIIKLKDSSKES